MAFTTGCALFDDYDEPWMFVDYPMPAYAAPVASSGRPGPACGCSDSPSPAPLARTGWTPNVSPIPPAGPQSREPETLR
jgi:hypothetical protein